MKRSATLLVLGAVLACGGSSQTCTIHDEGDGTSTIACPGSDAIRVPTKNTQVVCTASDSPGGKRQILCSDGTAYAFQCQPGPDNKLVCLGIFPGGGAIHGNASLFGLGPVAGITVRAGGVATQTDDKGEFALEDVAPGIYDVTFEYPTYGTQIRHNIPAVGLPWKMDSVVVYPAWRLDASPIAPAWAALSPDEKQVLAFTRYSAPAGPLTLWNIETREPMVLTYDGAAPVAPAFAADSSVVFVDALTDCGTAPKPDCGTIVIRAPDGSRRLHKGATQVRFFGNKVVFVDSKGELGIWDPSTDGVTIVDSGAANDVTTVLDVVPGQALVYRPGGGGIWNLWSAGTGSKAFHDGPPGTFCSPSSCIPPMIAGGSAVGLLDGVFNYWNAGDKVVSQALSNSTDGDPISNVLWARMAPDGKTAFFVLMDGSSLYLVDLVRHTWSFLSQSTSCTFPQMGAAEVFATCKVAYSADGSRLAFVDNAQDTEGSGTRLRLWNVRTNAKVGTIDSGANELVFAGSSLVYVVGGGTTLTLRLWKPDQDAISVSDGTSTGLVASPSGDYVLYGWALKDGIELRRLDVASGQSNFIVDHVGPSYQPSPSGKTVVFQVIAPGATGVSPTDGDAWLFRDDLPPMRLGGQGAFRQPLVWPGDDESFLEIQASVPPSFFDASRNAVWPLDDPNATVLAYSRKHVVYAVVDSAGTRTGLYLVYLP